MNLSFSTNKATRNVTMYLINYVYELLQREREILTEDVLFVKSMIKHGDLNAIFTSVQ